MKRCGYTVVIAEHIENKETKKYVIFPNFERKIWLDLCYEKYIRMYQVWINSDILSRVLVRIKRTWLD